MTENMRIEYEYKIISGLVHDRAILLGKLSALRKNRYDLEASISKVEAKIQESSHFWSVDEDGVIDIGLGIFI